MRIAAIADLHVRVNYAGKIKDLLEHVNQEADLLVIAGDLTDNGLPAEAEVLLEDIEDISIPKVAVLGNHDHENDQAERLSEILSQGGICLLDGNVTEINGVGFVGTKGFCGGFGNLFVQPFGERALKDFIQTSIDEAMRLENALAKLDCVRKVAVLHYSPIRDTLVGEPLELYPFLGSSRLSNALDRHGVDVVFHGHAHHGSPEGKTPGNIPVHNVSRFVLNQYDQRSYCLFDI